MNVEDLYKLFIASSGVSTDSRKVEKNQIFFALKGDNFDGNKFAEETLQKGCAYAVVEDLPDCTDNRYIKVNDCLRTLQNLAAYHRDQLKIPVLAITGSNGKTTTKELLARILENQFTSFATKGNLNNHIGVPLSILSIRDHNFAIIEMGANHQGEISFLCRIAKPNFGIITNIGKAHLEGFGSIEGVKKAKAELYQYLSEKNGTIFINGANDLLLEVSENLNLKKVFYKKGKDILVNGQVKNSMPFLQMSLKFKNEEKKELHTKLTGEYNSENILAAACIGKYFDIPPQKIIQSLETYEPGNYRSQFIQKKNNRIILDAYNANPTSMQNALMNFSKIPGNKKVVILGDMLELGNYNEKEHQKIIEHIQKMDLDKIFLVGKIFSRLNRDDTILTFENIDQLINHFSMVPVNDSLILIKGSRGITLEKIMDYL